MRVRVLMWVEAAEKRRLGAIKPSQEVRGGERVSLRGVSTKRKKEIPRLIEDVQANCN